MAYPYQVGLSTLAGNTGALSVPWPGDYQADDIGLLFIETSGDGTTLTPPTGWASVTGSPLVDVESASGSRFYAWWKRAASSVEANVTVADSGDHQFAKLSVYRNCKATGEPWEAVATATQDVASTTLTAPAVTTSSADALVVIAASHPLDSSAAVFSTATNATLDRLNLRYAGGTTSGNGGGIGLYQGGLASPGSSGTTSISKTSSTSCVYVIALSSDGPAFDGYDFPSLAPDGRRYGMGVFPVTTETGFAGGSIRFLHGETSSGHTLELQYSNLTQAEAELIREHYRFRQGGYESFQLSAAAWAGHTSATDLVPTTTRWKYAAVPEEVQKKGGYVDITVSLVSVI